MVSSDSDWLPRTGRGCTWGRDPDLAGFALGQVKVLSRKVYCMSLSFGGVFSTALVGAHEI